MELFLVPWPPFTVTISLLFLMEEDANNLVLLFSALLSLPCRPSLAPGEDTTVRMTSPFLIRVEP